MSLLSAICLAARRFPFNLRASPHRLHATQRILQRLTTALTPPRYCLGTASAPATQLFKEINWIDGDLNDISSLENGMKGCDFLVHCAAIVSFSSSDIEDLKKVNIEGTANVMNTALHFNYKRCIYISSVATLSREINFQNVDENCHFEPHKDTSNYAFTKYYAEQEVWRASNEGIDVVVLNPSIILGPGDWDKGSSKIFQRIFNGLKFYSTGSSGYVDVIDVAQIAKSLIFSNIKNERFILNGINIKFKEAFNLIADELNVERAHI